MERLSGRWSPYLYVAPVVILSGVLIYFFISFNLLASLTDWNGLTKMRFIGLDNYVELAQDRTFWVALKNTLLFMVITVAVQAVLGLLVAVLLKERVIGKSLFKAIFFLPIAMAPAIIATVFRYMFETNYGSLNQTLRAVGILGPNESVQWLGSDLGIYSIMLINIFQWMGFSMMIYYAALMAIPEEIYEAAEVDGAGWWSQLFSITIPQLKGTTSVLIILGIVGSLKTFDIVWLTTQGGPGASSHMLATFLYQERASRQAGYASAIGIVLLILAFLLALIQLRLSKKQD